MAAGAAGLDDVQALSETVETLASELEAMRDKLETARNEAQCRAEQLEDAQNRLAANAELESELADARAAAASTAAELADLRLKAEEAEAARDALEEDRAAKDAELDALRCENERLRQGEDEIHGEDEDEAKGGLRGRWAHRRKRHDEIDKLKARIEEAEAAAAGVDLLREEIKAGETQREELKEARAALEEKLAVAREENDRLRVDLDTVSNVLHAASDATLGAPWARGGV